MITRTALNRIGLEEPAAALARHSVGDWGEVNEFDHRANEVALRDGSNILSVYSTTEGVKFYIITEADRSYTTVLLPEDY